MTFQNFLNNNFSINWDHLFKIPIFNNILFQNNIDKINNFHHKLYELYNKNNLLISHENELKISIFAIICLYGIDINFYNDIYNYHYYKINYNIDKKDYYLIQETIIRDYFQDEDIFIRENVCSILHNFNLFNNLLNNINTQDLIKLSYELFPLKFLIYFYMTYSLTEYPDIHNNIISQYNLIIDKCKELNCLDKPYTNKDEIIHDYLNFNNDNKNNNKKFTVYILCGLPGAGKSTYIKTYLNNIKNISVDLIRCELHIGGSTIKNQKKVLGNKEQEKQVYDIYYSQLINCCENNEDCVLDDTNITQQMRKDILDKIIKYNPIIKIIYIESPDFLNTCKQRREKYIYDNYFNMLNYIFEFPKLYECHELIIQKQILNIKTFNLK